VIAGHALVQNVGRGHYELAVEQPVRWRVAGAFDELALAIWSRQGRASACRELAERNSADHADRGREPETVAADRA
jgi:hypothetical protein